MTNKKMPTTWKIKPHTLAKHRILEEYLKAWAPIISSLGKPIMYIDGFAGPGTYKDGEDGSPVIAMETIKNNQNVKESTNVDFWFIEGDKQKAEKLENVLDARFSALPKNMKCVVDSDKFENKLCSKLDEFEQQNKSLPPTFAFLDPCGYSGFPMHLIQKLLQHEKSEVLITFMAKFVNRFLDSGHGRAVTKLYGTDKFLDAIEIGNKDERIKFLLCLYIEKLKENNGAKYVKTFEIKDNKNNLIYYLIFGTKHWRGMEVMKEAMLKIDDSGQYSFSDGLVGQRFVISVNEGDEWKEQAANEIFNKFKGMTITVETVHQFVVIDTPYRFRKDILKILEKKSPSQIIRVPKRKRRFTYPDDCEITFSQS